MDTSKWTEKTQAALHSAVELAKSGGNSEVSPLHCAIALLDDPAGMARAAVLRASNEESLASLRRTLTRACAHLPVVKPKPSSPSVSQALLKCLNKARVVTGGDREVSLFCAR